MNSSVCGGTQYFADPVPSALTLLELMLESIGYDTTVYVTNNTLMPRDCSTVNVGSFGK